VDVLQTDLLYLALCRKSVPPNRLNSLGIKDRFLVIWMFIFEPNISLLSHQYTTHVDFLEFQSNGFRIDGSDGIGNIVSNDKSLFFGSTGKSDEEGVGITIYDLGIPFGSGVNQFLGLTLVTTLMLLLTISPFQESLDRSGRSNRQSRYKAYDQSRLHWYIHRSHSGDQHQIKIGVGTYRHELQTKLTGIQ